MDKVEMEILTSIQERWDAGIGPGGERNLGGWNEEDVKRLLKGASLLKKYRSFLGNLHSFRFGMD